jgi:two-component system chemotaxis sensor kinase CheA
VASLDQFWEEFQSEADEHLTTADRLIDQAHGNPLSADEVSELFRGFHSLKGLARAMDLEGMEALAHRAESLLGLVRDHGVALDADLVQGLAVAVGRLGQTLTHVISTREDLPAPADLLAELDRLQSERGGLAAASAPEAAPGGESGDMMSLLAELMREFLPHIAQLGAPVVDGNAPGAADAVTALSNAAEVMEMPELGEILAGLSAFAERAGPETLETRIDFLARLDQQAMLVGEITGIDAGADTFAAALAPLLADSVRDQLEILEVVVLPKEATAASTLLAAIGHRRGARLLALAGEAVAASSRGDITSSAPLVYAVDAAVAAVAGRWTDPLVVPDDIDEATVATHETEIRAALHATSEVEAPATEGDGPVAETALPEAFLPVLSTENRHDLERAIADGQSVYQLMTDVEAYEAEGEAGPLERLAELGQVVTSRTVAQGERTWFEFLIVSPLSPAELTQRIKTIDPGQRWIKAVPGIGDAAGGPPGEPAPAAGEPAAAPQAAPRPAPQPAPAPAGQASDAVLRVRGAAIDALMSAVGHARVEAAALSQLLTEDRRRLDAMTGLSRLREKLPPALAAELGRHFESLKERESEMVAADARLATALSQLHADALDLRIVPVETVLAHLPRVARELAQRQGKAVRVRLKGREVRIDKSVVQQLLDPLMHMMRNAVDHGIETPEARAAAGKGQTATITLRARQRASEFRLEVSDDGRGLNAEAIRAKAVERGLVGEAESRTMAPERIHRFVFAPGFSTAAAVTETSGRGVGMDVVMHTVTRLGGRIDIKTEMGVGTTFTLRLPLSAAVLPALLVEVAGQTFAIPERHIVAVEEVGADRIQNAGGRRVLLRGNVALPLHGLAGLLGLDTAAGKGAHAVVVASGPASIALDVDRLLRRQELLLRDLHPALAALPGIGGAALLGDGSPILVLDVDALIELARSGGRRRQARAEAAS